MSVLYFGKEIKLHSKETILPPEGYILELKNISIVGKKNTNVSLFLLKKDFFTGDDTKLQLCVLNPMKLNSCQYAIDLSLSWDEASTFSCELHPSSSVKDNNETEVDTGCAIHITGYMTPGPMDMDPEDEEDLDEEGMMMDEEEMMMMEEDDDEDDDDEEDMARELMNDGIYKKLVSDIQKSGKYDSEDDDSDDEEEEEEDDDEDDEDRKNNNPKSFDADEDDLTPNKKKTKKINNKNLREEDGKDEDEDEDKDEDEDDLPDSTITPNKMNKKTNNLNDMIKKNKKAFTKSNGSVKQAVEKQPQVVKKQQQEKHNNGNGNGNGNGSGKKKRRKNKGNKGTGN